MANLLNGYLYHVCVYLSFRHCTCLAHCLSSLYSLNPPPPFSLSLDLICREKAKELVNWLFQLEAEKFDMQYEFTKQRYEVSVRQGH